VLEFGLQSVAMISAAVPTGVDFANSISRSAARGIAVGRGMDLASRRRGFSGYMPAQRAVDGT